MAPAPNTASTWYDQEAGTGDDDLSTLQLTRGERIGSPVPSLARRLMKRVVLLAILAGGSWLAFEHQGNVAELWTATRSTALQMMEAAFPAEKDIRLPAPTGPGRTEPRASAEDGTNSAVKPLPEATMAEEPTAPALITGSLPDGGNPDGSPAPEPLERPIATDPLEKRAEVAGLHPGLSRVLLERLTDADYRNAKTAIDTALAETEDDGAHIFPRKREAGLALFRVYFVTGSGEGCRRYVVSVSKDGWLTTALPMERCGIKRRSAKKG